MLSKKIILIFIVLFGLTIGYFTWATYSDIQKNDKPQDRKELTNKIKCFMGDADSCYIDIAWHSSLTDKEKGKKLKELCDKTRQSDACYKVGLIYTFGHFNPLEYTKEDPDIRSLDKATKYLERACIEYENRLEDKSNSCAMLASLYYSKDGFALSESVSSWSIGFNIDLEKTAYYLIQACEKGDNLSCRELAHKLLNETFKVDKSKALNYPLRYLRIACRRLSDNTDISAHLCCTDLLKQDITNKEKKTIYDKLCTLNSYDSKVACYQNGLLYMKGEGMRQDYKKAKEYFGKACDLGHEEGCTEYAKLNEK